MSTSPKTKVAVIGSGNIGTDLMIKVVRLSRVLEMAAMATAYGKTPAQVMIRWHLQEGRSAIPKSVRPERIAENFDVFDFELSADELKTLDALDTGVRGGTEPDDITLENFGRPIPEA